ncbi:hypothetical protein ABW20_dc0106048 [Dactylellina cionopaga]|nr:hypothetical protein ABW20_dc0106048 [Dactylellina cionopaga]
MKKVLTPGGQSASLPLGWHRWFLELFFGEPKGVYTNWPGPVPDAFSPLSFLGLTFVTSQSKDEKPIWHQNLRVPGEDQSWTGPSVETSIEEELMDEKSAVIKADEDSSPSQSTEKEQQEKPKPSRRHSVGIQPDEVIEPSDARAQRQEEQSRRNSDNAHYSTVRSDGFQEHQREKPKRRARHSTNSMPGRHPRQYFMETTSTDGLPDSSVFDTLDDTKSELSSSKAEKPRYKTRKPRRRSSPSSNVSSQSLHSQTEGLPRAPSPPPSVENVPDVPVTPSPRKARRRASAQTSPSSSSRFRDLSPIIDYHPRDSSTSYMDTPDSSEVSWSGYASPPLPPTPRSPSSSVSYSSRNSYSTTSTSAAEDIVENINGEFTVKLIRSVSETTEGRYYKVRWANTWETKSSMRSSTESGKYKVREVLESRYVNGKGLYHVRWKDTWESEKVIGDIEAVRVFWKESAAGRQESSRRKSSA